MAEQACIHIHDSACGYQEERGETSCDCGTDTDEHEEGCAYQPAEEVKRCAHVHDEATCRYVEAVEGKPCKHADGEHDSSCGYQAAKGCPYLEEGLTAANTVACICVKLCESDSVNEDCEACADGQYGSNCKYQTIPYQSGNAVVNGVVETTNGTPVAGHTVTLRVEGSEETAEVVTDGKGKYSFKSLPDADCELILNASEESLVFTIKNGVVVGGSDLVVSATNIPGAITTQVVTTNGDQAVLEFIPSGDAAVNDTAAVVVENHALTQLDITYPVGEHYPNIAIMEVQEIEIQPERLTIEDEFISFGNQQLRPGEIISIEEKQYIVLVEEKGNFGVLADIDISLPSKNNNIKDIVCELETGVFWRLTRNALSLREGLPKGTIDLIHNKRVRINGIEYDVKYVVSYKDAYPTFLSEDYYLYMPDSGAAAGYYYRNGNGHTAVFNEGYDPESLEKKQRITAATGETSSGTRYDIMSLMTADISLEGVTAGEDGRFGTIGIKLRNPGFSAENIEGFHLDQGEYVPAAISSVGVSDINASWTVDSTSPFMIFAFAENNTTIPVRRLELAERTQTTKATNVKSPNTGDEARVIILFVIALINGGCVVAGARYKKTRSSSLFRRKQY